MTTTYFPNLISENNFLKHENVPLLDVDSSLFANIPYTHQRRGIQWMITREKCAMRGCFGGILMDEPGLGKTYQVWGTMVSNPLQGHSLIIVPAHLISMWMLERANHLSEVGQTICPAKIYYGKQRNCDFFKNSDYSHVHSPPGGDGDSKKQKILITSYAILARLWNIWEENKNAKTNTKKLLVGHAKAEKEEFEVAKFFFQTHWARLILDEAHMIRNCKTKQSKSIRSLSASRRWALTATPIVNKLDDLYALFNFISVRPYVGKQGKRLWNTFIRTASFHDMIPLRHLLGDFGLKRDKSVLELDAPIILSMKLEMTGYQLEFYQVLYNYCRNRTSRLLDRIKKIQNNHVGQNSQDVMHGIEAANQVTYCLSCALTQILRLKQAASCPLLAIRNMKRLHKMLSIENIDQLSKGNAETMKILLHRLKSLQNSNQKECPVCFDDEVDTLSLPCRHACCLNCWNTLLSVSNKCPICRTTVVSLASIKSELAFLNKSPSCSDSPNSDGTLDNDVEMKDADAPGGDSQTMDVEKDDESRCENSSDSQYASCKIDALLEFLDKKFLSNPDAKIIIVSQWHGFLQIVQKKIVQVEPHWRHLMMTGSSGTAGKRQKIVTEFQTNPNVKLLYMTLTAGGVGLTLTAATDMIFLDIWWNPAIHYQAQNRIHRIGQTKQVQISTMMVKDTIEEVIQEIIDHKALLSVNLMDESRNNETSITSDQWLGKIRCCLDLKEKDLCCSDGENISEENGMIVN